LNSFTKRQNFQEIAATPQIMDLAGEIRVWSKGGDKKAIATPDAIHLATAIKGGVHEFQTFDGGRKRGILDLNGNVMGHNLRIVAPVAEVDLLTDLGS
jgi:hypothetical protein